MKVKSTANRRGGNHRGTVSSKAGFSVDMEYIRRSEVRKDGVNKRAYGVQHKNESVKRQIVVRADRQCKTKTITV